MFDLSIKDKCFLIVCGSNNIIYNNSIDSVSLKCRAFVSVRVVSLSVSVQTN